MDAQELFVLGRRLMKIGELAMRGDPAPPVPAGVRLVMRDVLIHPRSSISEITTRTGLPQSYVSTSVARLRDRGILDTAKDPADARRTVVRVNAKIRRKISQMAAKRADGALGAALGDIDPDTLASIISTLEYLGVLLSDSDRRPRGGGMVSASTP